MKFWAYLHINGGIHVKRFFESINGIDPSVEDAHESPFVKKIYDPYEAENKEQAEAMAIEYFKKGDKQE